MHTERTHVVFKIIGAFLLLLGLLGIFLPFVPAMILIPAGLSLIGETRVHEWLRRRQ
ncbi:hypothetical protein HY639_02345 [Candidatus Woesearchaeota archaeon]|nr:hypothetical protein [Candidatus Woesearchaeota archaeon]